MEKTILTIDKLAEAVNEKNEKLLLNTCTYKAFPADEQKINEQTMRAVRPLMEI